MGNEGGGEERRGTRGSGRRVRESEGKWKESERERTRGTKRGTKRGRRNEREGGERSEKGSEREPRETKRKGREGQTWPRRRRGGHRCRNRSWSRDTGRRDQKTLPERCIASFGGESLMSPVVP